MRFHYIDGFTDWQGNAGEALEGAFTEGEFLVRVNGCTLVFVGRAVSSGLHRLQVATVSECCSAQKVILVKTYPKCVNCTADLEFKPDAHFIQSYDMGMKHELINFDEGVSVLSQLISTTDTLTSIMCAEEIYNVIAEKITLAEAVRFQITKAKGDQGTIRYLSSTTKGIHPIDANLRQGLAKKASNNNHKMLENTWKKTNE